MSAHSLKVMPCHNPSWQKADHYYRELHLSAAGRAFANIFKRVWYESNTRPNRNTELYHKVSHLTEQPLPSETKQLVLHLHWCSLSKMGINCPQPVRRCNTSLIWLVARRCQHRLGIDATLYLTDLCRYDSSVFLAEIKQVLKDNSPQDK